MLKTLPINSLQICEAYQRLVNKAQAKRIAEDFDEDAFGTLTIGVRDDKSKWVVDGQTRLMAAEMRGMKVVPCDMFTSRGSKHEARIFLLKNKHRRGVSSASVFKARLHEGEPAAVAICASVERAGLRIKYSGSDSPRSVCAFAALDTVYDWGGVELLDTTLRVCSECWPEDHKGVSNIAIRGTGAFLRKYGEEIKLSVLIKKMASVSVATLLSYSRDHVRLISGGQHQAFCDAMFARYNKGRRNRLAEKK